MTNTEEFKNHFVAYLQKNKAGKIAYDNLKLTPENFTSEAKKFVDDELVGKFASFVEDISKDANIDNYAFMGMNSFPAWVSKRVTYEDVKGDLYPLFFTEANDYGSKKFEKQRKIVNDVIAEMQKTPGQGSLLLSTLMKEGLCNEKMELCDVEKFKKNGKLVPLPEKATNAKVFGIFKYTDTDGRKVETILKHTFWMNDEKYYDPKCPKCGLTSWFKKCRNLINTTECGNERENYMVDKYMSAVGGMFKDITLAWRKDEKGVKSLAIKNDVTFPEMTALSRGDPKNIFDFGEIGEVKTMLKRTCPPEYFIDGNAAKEWWGRYRPDKGKRNYDALAIVEGYVSEMNLDKEAGKMGYPISITDPSVPGGKFKVFVSTPCKIFNCDKMRIGSRILAMGDVVFFDPSKKAADSRFPDSYPYVLKATSLLVLKGERPLTDNTKALAEKPKEIAPTPDSTASIIAKITNAGKELGTIESPSSGSDEMSF